MLLRRAFLYQVICFIGVNDSLLLLKYLNKTHCVKKAYSLLHNFTKQLHSLFFFHVNYKFITKLFYLQINIIANILKITYV